MDSLQTAKRHPSMIAFIVWSIFFVFPSSLPAQLSTSLSDSLVVDISYEQVLSRLEGEKPTRAMFASQQIDLTEFAERPAANKASAAASEVRAAFALAGYSAEYGWMDYSMDVQASDEQATIVVRLDCPVQMIQQQQYTFCIQPLSANSTAISLLHELTIQPPQTKLALINRVINRVACDQLHQQIRALTCSMKASLQRIVSTASTQAVATGSTTALAAGKTNEATVDDPPSTGVQDQPKENPIQVRVRGLKVGSGSVRLAVFADQTSYDQFDARKPEDKQGEAFQKSVTAVKQTTEIVIDLDRLPPGKYVIAAFHDVDDNGRLNASMLGLPSEPYGFSNQARARLGAPSFSAAVIEVTAETRKLDIELK